MLKFEDYKSKELKAIVGILGGKELASTTHTGNNAPHAKDIADRTNEPTGTVWDSVKWLTAEDPDFDKY